jgi:hypothetical protein
MKTIMRFLTIFILFFCAVSALFGGGAFIIKPSGELLQIPASYLEHSPFNNFLVPGIVLFSFVGISSIVVAIIVMTKRKYSPLALVYQGCVLIIWIVVQLIMIRSFNFLQAVYFVAGAFLVFSGIYFKRKG